MGDNGFHSIFFVLRLLCLFVAINCRFQDKYLLGGATSCSGNLARAFSSHFVFQFVTWRVYVYNEAPPQTDQTGSGLIQRFERSGRFEAELE